MKTNKKGFTLIEVLIVVSIIGILASIVLVGLGAFRSRGRDTRRIADLRQTQGGLELYYTKNQAYPSAGVGCGWDSLVTALAGPAAGIGINSIPNDPLAPARSYCYGVSQNLQQYALQATLEDINHPSLKDSAKGNPFGVSCDPTKGEYCVQF